MTLTELPVSSAHASAAAWTAWVSASPLDAMSTSRVAAPVLPLSAESSSSDPPHAVLSRTVDVTSTTAAVRLCCLMSILSWAGGASEVQVESAARPHH